MIEMAMPGGVENKDGHLSLGQELDDVLSTTRGRAKEVTRLTKNLRPVDSEGHSEDPDAENSYAWNKKAAKRLEWYLNRLRSYVGALSREIERRYHELDVLDRGRQRLHNEAPNAEYDLASGALKAQIDGFEARRKLVKEVIREAQEALMLSAQKSWPLGEPKERIRYIDPFEAPGMGGEPVSPFPSARTSGPAESREQASPSLGNQLGGLISKGPII